MFQFIFEKQGFRFLPVTQNMEFIAKGLLLTNLIRSVSFLIACGVGLLLALDRISKIRVLSFIVSAYIEFFKIIPLHVSIFTTYYCLPMFKMSLLALYRGILSLSLSSGFFSEENFSSGFQAIRAGQLEAARSIGLSFSQAFRKIVFSQSLRAITPLAVNLLAGMRRWSSLLSVIGGKEFVYRAVQKVCHLYFPIKFFPNISIYYLLVSGSLSEQNKRSD